MDDTITQKELLDDIAANFALNYVDDEFPDIVIKERGTIEEIPQSLRKLERLEASENLISFQSSHGNFTKKYREALGLRHLTNPFHFMRDELISSGILPARNNPIFKKMRGILRTDTLCTDSMGWGGLGKDLITDIESQLIRKSITLDLGQPLRIVGQVDGTVLDGQIYHLLKHKCDIAIEPVD